MATIYTCITVNQINRHPLIDQLLRLRGYSKPAEVEAFLNPNYETHLHDPFLMKGMRAAVKRIFEASQNSEKVVIYGDYDIDGLTASAVLLEALQAWGVNATSYIPDRFEEGYGINLEALQKLKTDEVDLVISVDCGITSVKEIEWANANGLDVIITDHHSVPEVVPNALAVINPKQSDCKYPFKELAGVGVAFKLVQALQAESQKSKVKGLPPGHEKWLLDLVALGTVCDVVPLVGENRALAHFGLLVMRKTKRIGLQALALVAGVAVPDIRSYHLGFLLGPRLNAAGRLEHAAKALALLTTQDESEAETIAQQLDQLNAERQAEQANILKSALAQAEAMSDEVIVLADSSWSHGIVGIVASKIVEKVHKPVVLMQILGRKTKGSARSTANFNLVEGLRASSTHLEKFGGHFFAAGLTLPTDKIDQFRSELNKYYKNVVKNPTKPGSRAELDLADLSEVDWDYFSLQEKLEPFGNSNPLPVFAATGLTVKETRMVGKEGNHLKITVGDTAGKVIDGIGFGFGATHSHLMPGAKVDLAFQISKNGWGTTPSLQLIVVEITNA